MKKFWVGFGIWVGAAVLFRALRPKIKRKTTIIYTGKDGKEKVLIEEEDIPLEQFGIGSLIPEIRISDIKY